jgi:hypothetical protein
MVRFGSLGKNFLTFLRLVRSLIRLVGARCSDAPKAQLLPLSVFGALFVSPARIISGHPGVAAFRKSAKKDAY